MRWLTALACAKLLLLHSVLSASLEFEGLIGADGNQWTACTHLEAYGVNFNQGLARFLAYSIPNITNALEFGCGIGIYVDYLCKRTNADLVVGIEPEPMVFEGSVFQKVNDTTVCPSQLAINVINAPPDLLRQFQLDREFDLVYSIEVAEHIPRQFHSKIADFLAARVGKMLVFSAARPGQKGLGHIAERPFEDWIEEFTERGLIYLKEATHIIRRMSDSRNINHRKNLLVFAHPSWSNVPSKTFMSREIVLQNPEDTPSSLWPELVALSKKPCPKK